MDGDVLRESRQGGNGLAVLNYDADLCGNIEQALKGLQGYGIMALELIQNADDAGARKLTFNVTPQSLIVWNSAEFTTCGLESAKCLWEDTGNKRPCNFHAISHMGGRSKLHAENQTGRFGIGFVSVYQVTDTPIVRSVGTQIVLNPLTREVPATRVGMTDGTEFELPWASRQSDIRAAINASPTPPDVVSKVVTEVQGVLYSSLLFLRNLEHVDVREAGTLRLRVEIERKPNEVVLSYSPEQKTERWLVLPRQADDLIADKNLLGDYEILEKLKRSTKVSVAIALNSAPVDGLLFAYLPTQHKTGMPVHINADFFPHASRQEIVLKGEGHDQL
jgi:hypothetical protein